MGQCKVKTWGSVNDTTLAQGWPKDPVLLPLAPCVVLLAPFAPCPHIGGRVSGASGASGSLWSIQQYWGISQTQGPSFPSAFTLIVLLQGQGGSGARGWGGVRGARQGVRGVRQEQGQLTLGFRVPTTILGFRVPTTYVRVWGKGSKGSKSGSEGSETGSKGSETMSKGEQDRAQESRVSPRALGGVSCSPCTQGPWASSRQPAAAHGRGAKGASHLVKLSLPDIFYFPVMVGSAQFRRCFVDAK